MAIIKCEKCGAEISDQAVYCPHCKKSDIKRIHKLIIKFGGIAVIVISVVSMMAFAIGYNNNMLKKANEAYNNKCYPAAKVAFNHCFFVPEHYKEIITRVDYLDKYYPYYERCFSGYIRTSTGKERLVDLLSGWIVVYRDYNSTDCITSKAQAGMVDYKNDYEQALYFEFYITKEMLERDAVYNLGQPTDKNFIFNDEDPQFIAYVNEHYDYQTNYLKECEREKAIR